MVSLLFGLMWVGWSVCFCVQFGWDLLQFSLLGLCFHLFYFVMFFVVVLCFYVVSLSFCFFFILPHSVCSVLLRFIPLRLVRFVPVCFVSFRFAWFGLVWCGSVSLGVVRFDFVAPLVWFCSVPVFVRFGFVPFQFAFLFISCRSVPFALFSYAFCVVIVFEREKTGSGLQTPQRRSCPTATRRAT